MDDGALPAQRREHAARPAIDRLRAALSGSDTAALGRLLHRRALLVNDTGDPSGGGAYGRREVAQALLRVRAAQPGADIQLAQVNGKPGLMLVEADGRVSGVLAADTSRRTIRRLWVCTAPEKLTGWQRSRRSR